MAVISKSLAATLASGAILAMLCVPASAAGIGVGVGASVGGPGGVNAGLGASVGGRNGVNAGLGASVGGSRGVNAGAGATVGGRNGVDAGATASIGGRSGVNAGAGAVFADGLANREDVVLVERPLEGRAAMPGSAEGDALPGDGGIGLLGIIRRNQARKIDEDRRGGRLAGEWAQAHGIRRLPVTLTRGERDWRVASLDIWAR